MVSPAPKLDPIARAKWANLRQALDAPVAAIVDYGEMLREAVMRAGPADFLPDLERICRSAQDLAGQLEQLRDQARALFVGADRDAVQRRVRHDLRTPLNAIKGYGEMLLEELADGDPGKLRADITGLLSQADRLLREIDIFLGGGATGAGAHDMFADLVDSLQVADAGAVAATLTGDILVVDDMAANRDLLARRLRRDGHRVHLAAGGQAALEILADTPFDLVLLDLMMPDLNGFEVLTRIKAQPHLHDLPVIMISALDALEGVARCIEAGAEDYLPKPFNPVLLKARIRACLEKQRWRAQERRYQARLEAETAKAERLLLNILPPQIVARLEDGAVSIADRYDDVTVLFADLVGFTEMSARLSPAAVVDYLNRVFSLFDGLVDGLGVEKIKMIGDAYMAVAGVPEARPDHAWVMAELGLRMIEGLARVNATTRTALQIRIGLHTGPVVAGIIGTHRFLYDVWGDTVNVASRLESQGVPGAVQLSEATARRLGDAFDLEPRGPIRLKGKGNVHTYLLRRGSATLRQ